jgi:hypothetical protein
MGNNTIFINDKNTTSFSDAAINGTQVGFIAGVSGKDIEQFPEIPEDMRFSFAE